MLDAATTERLREAFEAFFRGDVETTVAMMDPDVYGVDPPDMPDAGSDNGLAREYRVFFTENEARAYAASL